MEEIRLNLGCGPNAPLGWVNIDRSPSMILDSVPGAKWALHHVIGLHPGHLVKWPRGIRRHDVTKGLPFADGSVSAIYSSHTLEHLYLDDAERVLRECRRVLSAGGILRLALPDSRLLARCLVDGGSGLEFNKGLNAQPLVRPSLRSRLIALTGANVHRWQPTADLVRNLLQDAGFHGITELTFQNGALPDLATVEHRMESMFIEAIA